MSQIFRQKFLSEIVRNTELFVRKLMSKMQMFEFDLNLRIANL